MFEDFFLNWVMLVGVFSVALISPGPDFVVAVRHSIQYNRRSGIFTALGFAGGVGVHVTYCLMGIATIISQSIILFTIIKFIGAGYLIYIGVSALRSHGLIITETLEKSTASLSDGKSFRIGFMTNLLNPKATLFFLALFTQIMDTHIPAWMALVFGLTCIIMTFLWFSVVSTILTTPHIRAVFLKWSKWIDRICGGVLIAMGLRLALSKGLGS